MLAWMRDPQVPIDLRLDMAAAAAPFVHARPRPPSRGRPHKRDIGGKSSSTQRWNDVPRGTMDEVSSHVRLDLPFV